MKNKIELYDDSIRIIEYLSGKYKLILTTLNTKELADMKLQSTGIRKHFYEIFHTDVSSKSRHISKMTTAMYEHIFNELSITPNEIIHIGDNRQQDYDIPSSLGIKCYLLDRTEKKSGDDIIFSLDELKKFL